MTPAPARKTGGETFRSAAAGANFDVRDFWRRAASDLVSNATRGVLAEYIVARALGIATDGVRDEWAAWDLEWDLEPAHRVRIEVKSAAYVQSWEQSRPSRIVFGIRKTQAVSVQSGGYDGKPDRHADVTTCSLS